jgi:hypothetical protein
MLVRQPFKESEPMKFAAFQAEMSHHKAQVDRLERAGEREWFTPDGKVLFSVRVAICLVLRRARPSGHDERARVPQV